MGFDALGPHGTPALNQFWSNPMQEHLTDLESLDAEEAEATLFAAMYRRMTMSTIANGMLPKHDLLVVPFVKKLMACNPSRLTVSRDRDDAPPEVLEVFSPQIKRFFSILSDVVNCSGESDLPTCVLLRTLHAVQEQPLLCELPDHYYFLEVTQHGTHELGLVGAVDVTLPEPFTGGFEALLDLEFYEDPRQRRH